MDRNLSHPIRSTVGSEIDSYCNMICAIRKNKVTKDCSVSTEK